MAHIEIQPIIVTQTHDAENAGVHARYSGEESTTDHEANAAIAFEEDIPPNGGYGWVCTACVFMINAHTWGLNSAWAIFLAHFLDNTVFPGATHLHYALIGGLSISCAMLAAPLVAISTWYLGTKVTLHIGNLFQFAALFGAGYATEIWHLFLAQGVGFGIGMGFLYIPATAVLPTWFSTRRSLSMGIASSGAGLGGVPYNLLAAYLVGQMGVGWTYRILGFCGLAVNGICILLLRERDVIVKARDKLWEWKEYTKLEVLLVIGWGLGTELGYITLMYSLPNYASRIGLNPTQGSVVGALLSLGLGLGRPAVGYASDRWGRINVATLMTIWCGVLCLALWVNAKSYGVLLAFALLVGTGCGIFWNTVTPVTAEVTGLKRLPAAFGVICLALVTPSTFAELIALEIVDRRGYTSAQVFVGCMFLMAGGCTWLLRGWKVHDLNMKEAETAYPGERVSSATARRLRVLFGPQDLIRRRRV